MYTPKSFVIDDPTLLAKFIREHSFATLVTIDGAIPHATHVPMFLHGPAGVGGSLCFHLARANVQWRHISPASESLAIFTGPHAYVSPAWYSSSPNVPTWNYTAVHVYGHGEVIEDHARFAAMLEQLVNTYESSRVPPWNYDLPVAYRDQLMKSIVGIELKITRIEGKFKLSQNRPEEIENVARGLEESGDAASQEVARWMLEHVIDSPNRSVIPTR